MNLHEQARAEAEKRADKYFPTPGDPWKFTYADGFKDGFLAGHEAATRTRVVTVEKLADELCRASAVWNGHPYAGDVPCDQHKYEAEVVLPLLYDPEETR